MNYVWMQVPEAWAEESARVFVQARAIRVEPGNYFKFTGGEISPGFKVEAPLLASSFMHLQLLCNRLMMLFAEACGEGPARDVDTVACVCSGGMIPGILIAHAANIPCVFIHKNGSIEGTAAAVEGKRVLLVEDVVNTGGSTERAIGDLRQCGATVMRTFAYATYMRPAAERRFAALKVPLFALTTVQNIVVCGWEARIITDRHAAELTQWLENLAVVDSLT